MSNTPDNLDKKTKEVEELYTLYPFPGKINFIEKVFPERLQREGTGADAVIATPCIRISHVPDILHYVFTKLFCLYNICQVTLDKRNV